jgi:CarboxypepD_reg-like domain
MFCLLTFMASALKGQQVAGKVISGIGDPLIGVSIRVEGEGANTGAVTDTEGRFSIALPDAKPISLSFSYVGYEPLTLLADPRVGDLTVTPE